MVAEANPTTDDLEPTDHFGSSSLIILVHGTGASVEGPAGAEQWWQVTSAFATGLMKRLAEQAPDRRYSAEAFRWSGENSEVKRRQAGRELAKRLATLEESHTAYHLIGHSHGGSVIWHALSDLAARRAALDGLKSWTTVGTPFLEFSSRSNWYFALAVTSLIFLSGALVSLFGIATTLVDEGDRIFGDAAIAAVLGVLAGMLAVLMLALISLRAVITQIRLKALEARRRIIVPRVTAASKRWLGLAHDLDEPINGLAATLNRPPEIAPRRKPGDGLLSKLGAGLLSPYNRLIAPLVDAFVWDTGISRLQGRDVSGAVMTACLTSPPLTPVVWPPLPAGIRGDLSRSADAAASRTAAAFREELHEIGTEMTPPDRIAGALSWNEVIHTSYFGNPKILQLCADFIRRHDASVPGGAWDEKSSTAKWLSDGPAAAQAGAKPHFEPLSLYWSKSAALVGLGVVVTLGTVAANEAWLRPYTNEFQIENITENMREARFTRVWDSAAVGKVLVRLVALGEFDAVFESLANTKNPNTSVMAAELVAYAFGFYGNRSELDRLMAEYPATKDNETTLSDLALTLKTYALAGAVASDSELEDGLSGELESALAPEDGALAFGPRGPFDVAACLLHRTGNLSVLDRLMNQMAYDCNWLAGWVEANAYRPDLDAMSADLKDCFERQRSARSGGTGLGPSTDGPDTESRETKWSSDNPYVVARAVRQAVAAKAYTELAPELLAWNDDRARRVAGAVSDDIWFEMIDGLAAAEATAAAERARELYEWNALRVIPEFGVSESWSDKRNRLIPALAGLVRIGRSATLAAEATRLDFKAREDAVEDSFRFASESAFYAGLMWLELDNRQAAQDSFAAAVSYASRSTGMGESGFPLLMMVADASRPLDPDLANAAVEQAIRLFEDAYRISSVPDYSSTWTDVARVYAQMGEYRLAREAAERVGQRLGEQVRERETNDENKVAGSAFEKDSLSGSGVLGGYVEILDAEIRRRSVSGKAEIIDLIEQWPGPRAIYLTSLNRDSQDAADAPPEYSPSIRCPLSSATRAKQLTPPRSPPPADRPG